VEYHQHQRISYPEAGSTAIQELAFTLADGIAYVEAALARGLAIDDFAPRFSFFFNSHLIFLKRSPNFAPREGSGPRSCEERFGSKDPRSWVAALSYADRGGCSLTAQQPYNNIVRTALQALAAVLGGTQSLHTKSLDEVLSIPTEEARDHRSQDPADHCRGIRRGQYHRSPGGFLLCRVPHG